MCGALARQTLMVIKRLYITLVVTTSGVLLPWFTVLKVSVRGTGKTDASGFWSLEGVLSPLSR